MTDSYIGPEQRFVNWFNSLHPLPEGHICPIEVLNMVRPCDDERIHHTCSCALQSANTADDAKNNGEVCGVIVVDYGYSFAALQTKTGIAVVTRQTGYSENFLWPYSVLTQLGLDDTDAGDDEVFALDSFLQWIIAPRDRIELCFDVYRHILKQIVREMLDRLVSGVKKKLLISLPPIGIDMKPEWNHILSSIVKEDCDFVLTDHAVRYHILPTERLFSFNTYTYDGVRSYFVGVFDGQADGSVKSYAFAFDAGYETEAVELRQVDLRCISVTSKERTMVSAPINRIQNDVRMDLPKVKLKPSGGFTAFLSRRPATFRDTTFLAKEVDFPSNGLLSQIRRISIPHTPLPAVNICAGLCGEKDASRIALMDMVTISMLLENTNYFLRTDVVARKGKASLGQMNDLPLDDVMLPNIPANFSSVSWQCAVFQRDLPNYFRLEKDSLPDLETILLTIVDHYHYCTTEDIASDLYYICTGDGSEPSALLTAKVYMMLLKNRSFKIVRSTEPIQEITVDNSSYGSVDVGIDSTTDANERNRKIRARLTQTPINDMMLSDSSINSLKRAGYRTAGQLFDLTDAQLLKIRNLGRYGVEEIRDWMVRKGIDR